MRRSFFATLAGMVVMACMLLVQAPHPYAATFSDGACAKALCLTRPAQSQGGKLDQAPPRQMFADFLDLRIECPPGFECGHQRRHREFECPDGMHWNGEECRPDHKSKQKGGGGCVVGFHWNGHKCVADKNKGGGGCVVGFHWNGNKCVADKNQGGGGCVVGFHWNGNKCVADKNQGGGGCVVGFHWNGNKCVPDGQGNSKGCPEGTELVNGKCSKSEFPPIEGQEGGGDEGFSCSHNDHLENGKCVPCKAGFHVEGDECVAD